MTRAELLEKLRELKPWLEEQGIVNVRLFGSYARDEAGPDSDVDLLAEMTKPMGLKFLAIERRTAELIGIPVEFCSLSVMIERVKANVQADALAI